MSWIASDADGFSPQMGQAVLVQDGIQPSTRLAEASASPSCALSNSAVQSLEQLIPPNLQTVAQP